mmetsp:Transcript_13949/g.33457  ORF Transcript_13949/g.33457 Transcript_13949/m.33457 type:complete len:220 (+) Transcript_13949:4339-4998(+)
MTALRLGVGAICTVKLKYLHPRRVVDSLYTNAPHGTTVRDLLVLSEEKKRVNGKEQVVILLRHESFSPHDVYAVKRWCNVTVEGPEEALFTAAAEAPVPEPVVGENDNTTTTTTSTSRREDVVQVLADGFDVDDDDAPAPENLPDPTDQTQHAQTWGWDGICRRRQAQNTEHKAKMNGQTDATIKTMTTLAMFLFWFPTDWLVEVLLEQNFEVLLLRST